MNEVEEALAAAEAAQKALGSAVMKLGSNGVLTQPEFDRYVIAVNTIAKFNHLAELRRQGIYRGLTKVKPLGRIGIPNVGR